jgi:uncharacterized protein (TIGR02001 family)
MKIISKVIVFFLFTLFALASAQAEVSGKVAVVSNYLSYGLSQTLDDPAMQLTLNWSSESGLYLSGWASQVDFGEGTNKEFGAYAGYYLTFSDTLSLDGGIAQFSYEGTEVSNNYNYNELYATLYTTMINLGFHYSWDYFGTGAEYAILQASKQLSFKDWLTLTIGADYSITGDINKYSILGESGYLHYFVNVKKNWVGLQWILSLHETTMPESETNEARAVAGIEWEF